jgi:methylenetetrahydrofolate--tRNA-(uracil-5-)-methyltransferase
VSADSIDMSVVFRASRWGRSLGPAEAAPPEGAKAGEVAAGPACGADNGQGDYLNCPMSAGEYRAFYDALVRAESATVHDFDKERFFEGCLPVEVLAHRGVDTLRFGPMKPVGLADPRTGLRPHAVVQLRQDSLAAPPPGGLRPSQVGEGACCMIGLEARSRALRDGASQHRIAPDGAAGTCKTGGSWLRRPDRREVIESAASGLLAGINAAAMARGEALRTAPRTTAIGALAYYVSHAFAGHYEPSNITFGIMEPLESPPRNKLDRKTALSTRALADLARWIAPGGVSV